MSSDVPRPHVTPASVQTPQGGHIPSRGGVHQRGGGLLARVIPTQKLEQVRYMTYVKLGLNEVLEVSI